MILLQNKNLEYTQKGIQPDFLLLPKILEDRCVLLVNNGL